MDEPQDPPAPKQPASGFAAGSGSAGPAQPGTSAGAGPTQATEKDNAAQTTAARRSDEVRAASEELITRFTELADRMRGLGEAGMAPFTSMVPQATSTDPMAGVRALMDQAALPIRNFEILAAEIGARREQVNALRSQLAAFDEQLRAFEAVLLPIVEWGRSWSRLQQTMFGPFRGDSARRS